MPGIIESIRSDRILGKFAPKIAYVLSGGSAKGFSHLGMIEMLEKRGISPDLIVGTSAGALFGALYSHFGSVDSVCRHVEEVLESGEFKDFSRKYFGENKSESRDESGVEEQRESRLRQFMAGLTGTLKRSVHIGHALVTTAIVADKDAEAMFSRIFRGIEFDTLRIPFAAVSVDLAEGEPVIFTTIEHKSPEDRRQSIPGPGGLAKAVRASAAIPFVFPSVEIRGHFHADGYIMANLPANEARSLLPEDGCLFIGLDVSSPLERTEEALSLTELVMRLLDLATSHKQESDRKLTDITFNPIVKNYEWSSFSEFRNYITIGREYMTPSRLDSLDAAYRKKCGASIARRANLLGRYRASARLRALEQ